MKKPFKALVIGAGNMGAFYDEPGARYRLSHGHAIAESPDFQLIGFVDPKEGQARLASERWGGTPFTELENALGSSSVDLAVVSVPDAYHARVLHRLLDVESLSLVFTEKPLAGNLSDGEAVVRAYADRSVPLCVNYSRRFIKEFKDCASDIRNGIYGAFVAGCGYYGKGLFHNGSHLLDQLLFLTGDTFSVDHVSGRIIDYEESDPSSIATLKGSSGATFHLQAISSDFFSIYELDLIFESGRIRIVDSGKCLEIHRVVPDEEFAGYKSLQGSTMVVPIYDCLPAAYSNLSRFLDGNGSLESPACDALRVLDLCESIRRFE